MDKIQEKAIDEAFKILKQTEEKYLKVFGEHSLDRLCVCDPLYPIPEEILNGAKKLENAIKNNKPLKQPSEEIWKKMRF